MNAKQLKKIHIWIRAIIQLLYFIFIPSVYTAAFAGVKYIFTQIGAGEKVALTSFVTVLIVVCVYTAVFGRFFCGFACAFGSLGDGVNALYRLICKKMKKNKIRSTRPLAGAATARTAKRPRQPEGAVPVGGNEAIRRSTAAITAFLPE